ncbi:uncharacterized protein BP5553_05181 [Venustampulla echinocandica]|uniref:Apple domain-containing protein n=1 Tax=Venustampulla echinocandica TaxID=2656787 RepID=A0A370TQF0_9HELO|nr:uncharacterized protein BP5553_05181 [Venustampulla echinocandica]RDL37748.1 hypothetical protein BP5553_05181 [Venustampulla echinocandica]
MKSTISCIAVLLQAGLAFAKPYPDGSDHVARQVVGPPGISECLFENDAPPVGPPPSNPNIDVLGFCSSYIAPTKVVTRTVLSTALVTATQITTAKVTLTTTRILTTSSWTSTTTTTTTTTKSPTVTGPSPTDSGLCPTPVTNMNCGIAGWGYATNNIYTAQPIKATTCHQLCLQAPDCLSFQVMQDTNDASPQCNLYKVPATAENIIPGAASPYLFYDRNCLEYSPSNCKSARNLARAEAVGTPWFLTNVPRETLSAICSCIVTAPPPGTTVTETRSRGATATTTIGKTTTEFYTVTKTTTMWG